MVFSILFALLGFSYNVWRMEISEQNTAVRTACFTILKELAALEQLVYSAHYDQNLEEGNPRTGWVKVGLIQDLSGLTRPSVIKTAEALKLVWTDHWQQMPLERASADAVVTAIDDIRHSVKIELHNLK